MVTNRVIVAIVVILSVVTLSCEAATSADRPLSTPGFTTIPAATATRVPTATPTRIPTATPLPTATAVPFHTTSFRVAAGQQYQVPFDVQQGTTIYYQFASDLDFDFRVLDPFGNRLTWAESKPIP